MSEEMRIAFPFGGVSQAVSFQDQPPATCREAVNMRPLDPKTGRLRGAQRAGLSKFVDSAIGVAAVRNLAMVVKAARNVTYEPNDGSEGDGSLNPTIEWARQTPADNLVRCVATDRGGSVYAVSGLTNLVKFNADGEQIWTTNVPLPQRNHYLRAVVVDESDFVYVCSYSDTPNGKGRIFQYQQDDDRVTLVWTHELPRGFASDIRVQLDHLFYVENDLVNDEAYLGAMSALYASTPVLDWERPVPSPASQLALDGSGGVLVCSLPNAARDDEDTTACGVKTIDWNPSDDVDPSDLHCWHRAEDIVELNDNDTVEYWLDASGNGRGLFKSDGGDQDRGNLGGLYVSDAICGKPGVRFTQNIQDGLRTGLRAGNGSSNIIPVGNTRYFVAMVVRLRLQDAEVEGYTDNGPTIEVRDGKPFFKIAKQNETYDLYLETTYPDSTPASPHGPGTVANQLNAAIIVAAMNPDSGSADSYFRVNGTNVQTFECADQRNSLGNKIGYTKYSFNGGDFDLIERICITGDYGDPTISGAPSGVDGLIERVEGYLAHKFGIQAMLDAAHPFKTTAPVTGGGSGYESGADDSDVAVLRATDGIVARFAEGNGALQWAYSGDGVGYGVAVRDGFVWNVGPPAEPAGSAGSGSGGGSGGSGGSAGSGGSGVSEPSTPSSGSHPTIPGDLEDDLIGAPDQNLPTGGITVRRMADFGHDYSIAGANGGWVLTLPVNVYTCPRLSVDEELNCYFPAKDADDSPTLYKIQASGIIEWELALSHGIDGNPSIDGDAVGGLCTALPQTRPDYGDDTIKEPEFLYLGTDHNDPGDGRKSLVKLGLVRATQTEGSPREVIYLAVSDGNIRRMHPGESPDVTTPTDGAGALSATSSWIQSATLFQKVFYVDGESYRYYDPTDDAVHVWKATSAGSMPARARLVAAWNGSIVLARFADSPNNWHISRFGDPFDWDRFPTVRTLTDSVSGNDPGAGLCPDIINAIIPIADDLLIFGCEQAIYRLTGHPLQGGQFDRLPGDTGMLYGTPWCRDTAGGVYFFGSSGGVYRFDGVQSVSISAGKIDKLLRDVDYNTYTVQLCWNQQDQGLHVFIVRYDQSAASGEGGSLAHWFWHQPTDSWWEDEFNDEGLDPTACLAIWGDAEDERVVLVGHRDGHVRRWDVDATGDDGTAIDARVTIGPLVPSLAHRVRFSNLRVVLDASQNGAALAAYDSDDPATLGDPIALATLVAGRNGGVFGRFRGQACWLKLSNANLGERFALEQMVVNWHPAGRVR